MNSSNARVKGLEGEIEWKLIYLPTGRIVVRDGVETIKAKSERAAKLKFTKLMGYVDWKLHAVYVV